MKRFLLLAGITAVFGLVAPAHADPVGCDAAFLTALSGAGLSHSGSDQVAISAGHSVCQLMDAGLRSEERRVGTRGGAGRGAGAGIPSVRVGRRLGVVQQEGEVVAAR